MGTPVSGTPRRLLQLEGGAVLLGAVLGYQALGASWILFALLVLLPDLSLAGYLAGPRVGARFYNAVHTLLAPATLAAVAYLGAAPGLWPLVLTWVAHIGLDRALGLGLKFGSSFADTHLGRIGHGA